MRLIRKGALIEETYSIFRLWEPEYSVKDNLTRIRRENPIGARSESWLREITATISSRFTREEDVLPLALLALGKYPLDKWKSCLLWQIGKVEEIYYRFATEWLFEEFKAGTHLIRTEDVVSFVNKITDGRLSSGRNLSEYGALRSARDLLRVAADLGLLRGRTAREFAHFCIDEEVFLYVLHAMAEDKPNATVIVNSPDWRLFMLSPEDVEREVLRLHQYRKLHYEVAGSLSRLELPCRSLLDYVRGIVQ